MAVKRRGLGRGVALTLVPVGILLACGAPPGPSRSSMPVTQPSVAQSVDQDELERQRDARRAWGLRSDQNWVGRVMNSRDATYDFGFALLPFERDQLFRRPSTYQDVAETVEQYGLQHPKEWADLFIDQSRGGLVVAQFTADVSDHESAIQSLLRPDARFEIREVRWSLEELKSTVTRISDERAWFRNIPAVLYGWGVDGMANKVSLDISSSRADAAAVIAERFGIEPEMLGVNSDGTGAQLLPDGKLVVVARDGEGNPVEGLLVSVEHQDASLSFADACATDAEGTCVVDLKAVTYQIVLERLGSGGRRVVGRATAAIPAGGMTRNVIIVSLE